MHLLYADDTPIFSDSDPNQVDCLWRYLRTFELLTGMKVNLAKTKMIGVLIANLELHSLALHLGCFIESLPSSYLGLPLCRKTHKTFMGQPHRKIYLEIYFVEGSFRILWGKNHPNQSNPCQHPHLLYVSLPNPNLGIKALGKTNERFPLGRSRGIP
ncbi:hypothetical protein AMTRI_Chr05g71180 [Amborella trichopoda]